ncbi:MAG: glycoside hydrolase family 113 [Bacteroidota bacterium]
MSVSFWGMRWSAALIGGLLLTGIGGSACTSSGSSEVEDAPAPSSVAEPSVAVPDSARLWAVTLDAREPPTPDDLDRIAALGTTHLTLIPFGFQRTADTPRIRLNTDAGWYSESDAGIRTLAQEAADRDMGLVLKPHLWLGSYDTDGQERNAIGFDTEAEWTEWEAAYTRFLVHYARLARDVEADVLVVGTELARAAHERPDFWRALIDTVRTVYDGDLTYAANWYDEYETIPFWDALDYIGVQAYFPLADAQNPSTNALVQGWDTHVEALSEVAARAERPVLFTEVGYRSVKTAAAEPWVWPDRNADDSSSHAPELQARLYQALFARFRDVPWFAGAVFWKWHPAHSADRPQGFTPQDKPAEDVIRRGFRQQDSGVTP